MAQSILKHPRAVMSDLRREYEVTDEEEILAFLERHPDVAPLLFEIRRNIRRYFGEDRVRLGLSFDLEWPEEEPNLIVAIQTPRSSRDALTQLRQFDDEWWTTQLSATRPPVIVTIEHIRRV